MSGYAFGQPDLRGGSTEHECGVPYSQRWGVMSGASDPTGWLGCGVPYSQRWGVMSGYAFGQPDLRGGSTGDRTGRGGV